MPPSRSLHWTPLGDKVDGLAKQEAAERLLLLRPYTLRRPTEASVPSQARHAGPMLVTGSVIAGPRHPLLDQAIQQAPSVHPADGQERDK